MQTFKLVCMRASVLRACGFKMLYKQMPLAIVATYRQRVRRLVEQFSFN